MPTHRLIYFNWRANPIVVGVPVTSFVGFGRAFRGDADSECDGVGEGEGVGGTSGHVFVDLWEMRLLACLANAWVAINTHATTIGIKMSDMRTEKMSTVSGTGMETSCTTTSIFHIVLSFCFYIHTA